MYDDHARQAAIQDCLATLQAATAVESRSETVREAADEYCDAVAGRHKPSTEANREYYLGRFSKALGEVALADLDVDDVSLWLNTLPVKSHHNVCTVLEPFLKWASQNGWPHAYQAKPVRLKRDAPERHRYLSWMEFARAATARDLYSKNPRSRSVTVDALWMSLVTPFRSGEVVTLRAEEVSPMGDYIFLQDSKTGGRKVWLGQRARSIVQRLRSRASGSRKYLFPGRDHSHILQPSLSKAWRRLADSAGLEDVVLHDLRRTWASLALDSGEHMQSIRIALGHSTKHMTARYAHLGDERLSDVATRVEQRLLDSLKYQLELPLPEPDPVEIHELTECQRSLLCCPGSEVFPRGPGQAQAALALVRHGLLVELRKGAYGRTPNGEELRGVSNAT